MQRGRPDEQGQEQNRRERLVRHHRGQRDSLWMQRPTLGTQKPHAGETV